MLDAAADAGLGRDAVEWVGGVGRSRLGGPGFGRPGHEPPEAPGDAPAEADGSLQRLAAGRARLRQRAAARGEVEG